MKYVAQPLPHESACGHVTGGALYTGDLAARFPNLLHAYPVLAPHAHATLLSLDPAGATLLTASDVPGEGNTGVNRHDEPRP